MADAQHIPRKSESAELIRGVGLGSAIAVNMAAMIGVGPFITLPLIVAAMGGPQAILGWILGALLALCDGLVWAELGAALPGSGGSYRYLSEIYGPRSLGRLMSFLFIWQLSFSAPLSIASGCIGLSQYAAFLWPGLERTYVAKTLSLGVPVLGSLQVRLLITRATFVAILVCLLAVILLYRRITAIGHLSKLLLVGVLALLGWIIFAGLTHFSAARAFSFPPGAFGPSRGFFLGLGASMLITTYNYWGYYEICFLGGEVKDPGKTIPRALLFSILLVSCLYVLMTLSVLGVIPWQEVAQAARSDTHFYVISTFIQRLYGPGAAMVATALVMWTAFSSVFALLLGYSRVPYTAALDGNYFRVFGRLHPRSRFPYVSLLALGLVAAAFCTLRLADVIAALVVIRIVIQYLVQAVGVIVFRMRRPDLPRPFRMWLYPFPAVAAGSGFLFILVSRRDFHRELRYAIVILALGTILYFARAWRGREWPFTGSEHGGR